MSEQVSVKRHIAASADSLYDLVSDLPRMGEWSNENTGGKWVGKGAAGQVGSRFKGTNRNGRHGWTTTSTVVAANPAQQFAFDVTTGPVKISRWAYLFESHDDGTTTVTETWTDHRPSLLVKPTGMLSGVKDRVAFSRAGMERTLEALAATAES